MKYLIRICLLVAFLPAFLKAQTAERPFALGLWGGSTQYNGDLGQGFYSSSGQDAHLHIGLSAAWFVTNHFDFAMNTTIGTIGYREDQLKNFEANQFQWNAQMRAHLFKEERFRVNPYGLVGIGISYLSELKYPGTDIFFPFGAGLKVTLTPKLNLHLQETFAYTDHDNRDKESGDNFDSFLMHSIGLSWNFAGPVDSDKDGVNDKKDKCPDTPAGAQVDNDGCPLDRDGDGIPDFTDVCPDVKGVKSAKGCPDRDGDTVMDSIDKCIDVPGIVSTNPLLNGCPDKDGDGITDADDRCPELAGTADLKGCPDTDGDGLIDPEDKCPQDKGLAELQGCPDKDGDKVADVDDGCPDVAGSSTNKGCPEDNSAANQANAADMKSIRSVYFDTGKDIIRKGEMAKLNMVVKVLNANANAKLEISGHTDNTGEKTANQELSQRRAEAAKAYLISKGIAENRISTAGFGDTTPASDNNTAAGRSKNRRVDFKINN